MGEQGSEAGQFINPAFLTVAPDVTLYVADAGNHRVLVFRGLPSATATP